MNEYKILETYKTWVITCPKHGEHHNVINSNIKGYEGHWCQICWIEMLGESLPAVYKEVPFRKMDD